MLFKYFGGIFKFQTLTSMMLYFCLTNSKISSITCCFCRSTFHKQWLLNVTPRNSDVVDRVFDLWKTSTFLNKSLIRLHNCFCSFSERFSFRNSEREVLNFGVLTERESNRRIVDWHTHKIINLIYPNTWHSTFWRENPQLNRAKIFSTRISLHKLN